MGYLAIRDTGSISLKIDEGLFEQDVRSPDGMFNPTDNYGVVDLRVFNLDSSVGKDIDTTANIAGVSTRPSVGGRKVLPITLSCRLQRKADYNTVGLNEKDRAQNYLTPYEMEALTYLSSWSLSRNILLLFYMPDNNSTDELVLGQCKDFFSSTLKPIYDVVWDRNSDSSSRGYQTSSYGSYHFKVVMGGAIGDYEPCALPIVLEEVNWKEDASSKGIVITALGYVLEPGN